MKDKQNNLTKKIKSVFSKTGKKTAIDGGEPTFHTSKTYGGTIPYLPGKFKEEYSEELVENENKRTTKTKSDTNSKSKNTTNTKNSKK